MIVGISGLAKLARGAAAYYKESKRIAIKALRREGLSLRDMAKVLGLSRERIRQIGET